MHRFARILRSAARIATLALAATGMTGAVRAQGDLLVAPTRVIVNGGGSTEVVLNNIGATPATYRIALELRRMTPDGELETIETDQATAEEKAMLDAVRYAPRRIVLPPNQPQSVRISVRPGETMTDGEYRVHMSFRAIPDARPVEAAPAPEATGLSIRLTPIYGISIPVILRKGALDAGARIAQAGLVREGGDAFLKLDLERTGKRSVYGEIRVMAPGAKQPAYLVRGVAIYPELARRSLQLALSPAQAAAIKGPMTVEYREMPEAGGKLIASTSATF
ncbi:MAG: hypothetical protein RIQ46_421 [Pseudomonadota bacterium]|jgi:hypothetical protein